MTRRKLAWLAVGCGFSAIVAVLVGTLGSISAFSLRTYEVAGEVEFQVGQAGTWVLACETRATVDGVEKSGRLILPAGVHLIDPAGGSRELMPANRSIRYSDPSRAGEILGSFDASPAGTWKIRVAAETLPALCAVGPDPAPAMAWWVLISGGLAIVLLGSGAGFGWVAWRHPTRAG